jgi:hypothetical protein
LEDSLGKVGKNPSQKQRIKGLEDVTPVVEYLPTNHKALGLTTSTTKKRKRKQYLSAAYAYMHNMILFLDLFSRQR